jgi:hypothetical protein
MARVPVGRVALEVKRAVGLVRVEEVAKGAAVAMARVAAVPREFTI